MQRQKSSPYTALIAAATGAPDVHLATLENIMREEIFHSTLDWQSAEQFADGAREAYALYLSSPAYYDALAHARRMRFQLVKMESRLEKARKKATQEKIADLESLVALARETEARARTTVARLANFYALA